MNKNLFFIILLLWCRTLVAADMDILVKGLTTNRAILLYKGQLMVLKKGQTRQGIKLLDANENRAIIENGGQTLYLFLDQSIARQYSKPEQRKKQQVEKVLFKQSQYQKYDDSRVVALILKQEQHNSIMLELEYYYDGKYGRNADLVLSVINKGRLLNEIKKQYFRLEKGQNKIQLQLDMKNSDKMVFYSEAINISFLARSDKTYVFYSKTIKFEKYWKKVAVR